ncbi:hypothetical protein Avbf_11881 [Armadillidium vulgare]|nr:hypothetical protein Avbf_11881 [Armadillidium vulgare]
MYISNCLYVEDGVGFLKIDEPLSIDFYIPHNWKVNEDDLNNLNLRLFNTNLTLRHPSISENETDEINLPLSELRIGWNTIYLRKTEDKFEVLVKVLNEESSIGNENSEEHWKVIQNVTQEEFNYTDPFYVSGLYSLVNCKAPNENLYV